MRPRLAPSLPGADAAHERTPGFFAKRPHPFKPSATRYACTVGMDQALLGVRGLLAEVVIGWTPGPQNGWAGGASRY